VTPLLYLNPQCDDGHWKLAAALLAAGADINAASTQPFIQPRLVREYPAGTTFLHRHAECGYGDNTGVSRCIQLALQAGANVRAVDGNGWTPPDLATWSELNRQALLAAQQQQQEQQAQQPTAHAASPPPSPLHSEEQFPPLGTPSHPAGTAPPALDTADGLPAPPGHLPSAAAAASGKAALPSRDQGGPAAEDAALDAAQDAAPERQQLQDSAQHMEEQGSPQAAQSCEAPAGGGVAAWATREVLTALPVKELKRLLRKLGIDQSGCTEKRELVDLLAGRCTRLPQQGGQQAQQGHQEQRAQVGESSGAACCSSEGGSGARSSAGAAAYAPSALQEQPGVQEQWQTGSSLQPGAERPPQVDKRCACCDATPGPGVRLKLCCGCRSVRYCGNACQQRAWPQHKAACRAAQQGG